MKIKFATLFVVLVDAVFITACGAPTSDAPQGEAVSALTQEEATSVIDNALQALNTGDYATWSRDWDNDMKAAIKEADFKSYRDQVVTLYGQYVSIESLEILPGLNEGNVRWVAIANFEKGKIKFTFGFPNEGRQIKGIFPEAVE
jgi:hypothetical protein